MKAFLLKQTGGAEQLHLEEVPKPNIQANEVLVKVKAISINPVDVYVRKDSKALKVFMLPKDNQEVFILGWDMAGIVEEVGADVKDFKQGDLVFGLINFRGAGNTYAEYVAAPASQLALIPNNISSIEAVKRGGRIISLLTDFEGAIGEAARAKGVWGYHMGVASNGDNMQQIASLLDLNIIRSHINASYNFVELPKAHQHQDAGNRKGKIVVKM